ncbi:hypothetical protein HYU16_02585 [Candidatus Woesearchaeota archaeon]|nr:hypothetical protein [Candidatus Woesearchaeota archaeon]
MANKAVKAKTAKGKATAKPTAAPAATGLKEKILSATSSASGLMGIFSSWTVCHNVCTAAIALLALIGVTVVGMPLLFLQKVAVPFWTAAVILFGILLLLKLRKMGCLSGKALMLNAGLIVAGTPFQAAQQFNLIFWTAGGALVALSVILLIKDKIAVKTKAGVAKAK